MYVPRGQDEPTGRTREGSGSASRRPPGMGECRDEGTKPAPSSQAPCPPVIGICPVELVTPAEVVYQVESGSFVIRPEGLKRKEGGRGCSGGPCAWGFGAVRCQVVDLPWSLGHPRAELLGWGLHGRLPTAPPPPASANFRQASGCTCQWSQMLLWGKYLLEFVV